MNINLILTISVAFIVFSCNTSKNVVSTDEATPAKVEEVTEQSVSENEEGERRPRRPRGGFSEQNREEYNAMVESLGMNEIQGVQFKVINESFRAKMQKKREEARASGSFEGMREEMRTLRDQQNGAIKNLLTEDQYKIYSAFLEKQRSERGGRGDRGN